MVGESKYTREASEDMIRTTKFFLTPTTNQSIQLTIDEKIIK